MNASLLRTIPDLIIANGVMRGYEEEGAGNTFTCIGFLEEVADDWGIPIEFVQVVG